MNNTKQYCLILAGGTGKRLWPCSRKNKPKQFLDFFGLGRTLLQQTYDRFSKFIPKEQILISTFKDYVEIVKEQLPDVKDEQLIVEPVQLSTASAAAWSCEILKKRVGDAVVIISPSDQHIINESLFAEQMGRTMQYAAEHSEFVAIGVPPTTPNTGYGYIQMDEPCCGDKLSRVQSFTEKPDLQFAEMFVNSGEFLWNTGLFVCNLNVMHEMVSKELPLLAEVFESCPEKLSYEEEQALAAKHFPSLTHGSINLLLLEKTDNIVVLNCDFGWADVGAWPELHEVKEKDADYNAVIGGAKVLFDNSFGNLVCLPDTKAAVIAGLEGFLVAEKDGVLVICPNGDATIVRRLVTEAQVKLGEDCV